MPKSTLSRMTALADGCRSPLRHAAHGQHDFPRGFKAPVRLYHVPQAVHDSCAHLRELAVGMPDGCADEPLPEVEVRGGPDESRERRRCRRCMPFHCCLQHRQESPVHLKQGELVSLHCHDLFGPLHCALLLGRLSDAVAWNKVSKDCHCRQQRQLTCPRIAAQSVKLEEDIEQLQFLLRSCGDALCHNGQEALLRDGTSGATREQVHC